MGTKNTLSNTGKAETKAKLKPLKNQIPIAKISPTLIHRADISEAQSYYATKTVIRIISIVLPYKVGIVAIGSQLFHSPM